MQYQTIPTTDLTVSSLCLGTADMGTRIPPDTAFTMLNAFVEAGGTFLDTARVYAEWVPGGRHISEKTLGRWLAETGNRDRVVIATKGGHPPLDAMHVSRLSPADIAYDVDGSLADLGTDRLDLFYLHRDDPTIAVEEIMNTLWQQVDAGKVRYLGCSNWTLPRIKAAQAYAAQRERLGFVANQMLWSAAVPNTKIFPGPAPMVAMDDSMRAWHEATQMAAVPYSSQANGFFQKVEAGGINALKPGAKGMYASAENERRVERARKLAAETGLSITQITLGYLRAQPFPVVPIVGPASPEQLADTLTADDVSLTREKAMFLGETCG